MGDNTTIEWAEATWNPIAGCSIVSPGCTNCYAMKTAAGLERRFGSAKYAGLTRVVNGTAVWTGEVRLAANALEQPLRWKRPRRIFVNSMSDLFHKDVPRPFIDKVFDTMERANWHVFQVLTKRSSLLSRYLKSRYDGTQAPAHIWCGVSVEDAQAKSRINHLRSAPASIRFLSLEPLLGPLGRLELSDIDWVIAGGESGPGARPMDADWVRSIRDECLRQNVAFFFKQWGGIRPKTGGRKLDNREWNEYPGQREFVAAAE
jgi:protein gp37